jgi:hypothetical protein
MNLLQCSSPLLWNHDILLQCEIHAHNFRAPVYFEFVLPCDMNYKFNGTQQSRDQQVVNVSGCEIVH